jgi:hypothetical protein
MRQNLKTEQSFTQVFNYSIQVYLKNDVCIKQNKSDVFVKYFYISEI